MNGGDNVKEARDIPELIPLKDYDVGAAKLRASISWLLTKAYGDSRSGDLAQPFYDDPQGGSYLKPSIVNGLVSGDTYCRACSRLFRDTSVTWKGHQSVIQALSRLGIYIMDTRESAVTENVLLQTSPFKVDSHLALIDGLMMAQVSDIVTVQRAVQAVKKFASLNASSELPYSSEDAILLWLNKSCSAVRRFLDAQQAHLPQRQAFGVPVVDNIEKDLNDGCCVAATISFYCPNILQLHHLALHETVGLADSLFNLQLIKEFCTDYCPSSLLHLSINDLFHSPPAIKPNLLVFLAELFRLLELDKPSFVRDTTKPFVSSLVYTGIKGGLQENTDPVVESKTLRIAGSSKPPAVIPGVSNATKRSFQQDGLSGSNPDLSKHTGSISRQPLLPKRLQAEANRSASRRSHSLTSVEDRAAIANSVEAWNNQQQDNKEPFLNPAFRKEFEGEKKDFGLVRTGSLRGSGMSNLTNVSKDSVPIPNQPLLTNVSMDSDISLDFTDGSIDLGDLSSGDSTSRSSLTPVGPIVKQKQPAGPVAGADDTPVLPEPGHPDFLELQSMSSRTPSAVSQSAKSPSPDVNSNRQSTREPLLPAQLKPAKEKSNNNHTKEVESGEKVDKRSPSTPSRPSKPLSLIISNSVGEGDGARDSSGASTPSEEYQTPSLESVPLPGESEGTPELTQLRRELSRSSSREGSPRKSPAVFNMEKRPPSSRAFSSLDRNKPVAQSFTLHDHPTTPEGARAAGIPIVDAGNILNRIRSKQTEVATSSDGSDQELSKIHADTTSREKLLNGPSPSPPTESLHRPDTLNLQKTNSSKRSSKARDKPSPKTSFAQIKKQRENGQTAVVIFEQNPDPPAALRDRTTKPVSSNKPPKKTSFAALPNQTTWQQKAESNNSVTHKTGEQSSEADSLEPLTSELVDIRMRLAERRRQMDNEKRQKEQELNSQRQKVGKQAFIQVISKKEPPSKVSDIKDSKHEPEEKTTADKRQAKSASPRPLTPVQTQHTAQPAVVTQAGDSKSPRASSSRESSPRSKSFSREHIQNMIDSGRKKWFREDQYIEPKCDDTEDSDVRDSCDKDTILSVSERSREASPRPIISSDVTQDNSTKASHAMSSSIDSSHDRQFANDVQRHGPMTSSVDSVRDRHLSDSQKATTMSSSLGSSSTYNASLDKLNCSLSELQGEIMRLSLQQDQIKTMVGNDTQPEKQPVTTAPHTSAPTESFYSDRHGAAGEPDIAGSTHHQTYQTQYPQQPVHQPPPPPVQYPPHPYPGYQYQPYSQYPPAPHYQPSPHLQYPPQYPQQPYPAMPPQWQSPPIPGAPYSSAQHTTTSAHMAPQHSTYHPNFQPSSTHTVSSHQTQVQSPVATSSGGIVREGEPMMVSSDGMTQTTPVSPPITGKPVQHSSSMHSLSQPHSPQTTAPQPVMTRSLPADPHNEDTADPSLTNDGFFVSFDNETPRKPKPKLGGRREKNKNRESSRSRNQSGDRTETAVESTPAFAAAAAAAAAVLEEQRKINASPGVGFIVGDEATVIKEEMTELEKKKQKLMQQQQKRKQEAEIKRLKTEQERATKKEQEKMKKEAAEQKKADDKARRDAIYQQYLERKAERESSEEPASSQGSPASAPAARRHKNKTRSAPRPKSQPPGTLPNMLPPPPADFDGNNRAAKAYDLAPDGSVRVVSFGGDSGDGSLAYGGITHRRPPTPDRYARGQGDENGGTGIAADYMGPKLFVKPSAKSNRHIMMNAISHCCLAGAVNTDVKNKVLEIIGQSAANHFVILFRDAGMQYKGLYTYNVEKEEVFKIHGVGPKQLTQKMFDSFFKYNSGGKSFSKVSSTKHLSATIDAVTIHASLWQKKQQVAPSKKPPLLY